MGPILKKIKSVDVAKNRKLKFKATRKTKVLGPQGKDSLEFNKALNVKATLSRPHWPGYGHLPIIFWNFDHVMLCMGGECLFLPCHLANKNWSFFFLFSFFLGNRWLGWKDHRNEGSIGNFFDAFEFVATREVVAWQTSIKWGTCCSKMRFLDALYFLFLWFLSFNIQLEVFVQRVTKLVL